jgi:hypothetical protein
MRNSTTVTCKYSSCLHDSKELNREDAVKSGNSYYHSDCYKTKEDIKTIIDLFKNHINPNPVYSQLQSVIKNIVFTKGLGSDFLLFGLQYYIEHKIPLNYPQGLYYVIQNKNVIDAYNKSKLKDIKKNIEIKEETNSEFQHIPVKNNGFADILK